MANLEVSLQPVLVTVFPDLSSLHYRHYNKENNTHIVTTGISENSNNSNHNSGFNPSRIGCQETVVVRGTQVMITVVQVVVMVEVISFWMIK